MQFEIKIKSQKSLPFSLNLRSIVLPRRVRQRVAHRIHIMHRILDCIECGVRLCRLSHRHVDLDLPASLFFQFEFRDEVLLQCILLSQWLRPLLPRTLSRIFAILSLVSAAASGLLHLLL